MYTPSSVNDNMETKDLLNAINNSASASYQSGVPMLTSDSAKVQNAGYAFADNAGLRMLGQAVMSNDAWKNEFLSALYNRIGFAIITSKSYENPIAFFKKGVLEIGDSIEEIFTALINPHRYDMEKASQEVYKIERPSVYTNLYKINSKTFYKVTTTNAELKRAFTSWSGVNDLINSIIAQMYTSMEYDEFECMKYIIAYNLINGTMKTKEIGEFTKDTADDVVSSIKELSNDMTFFRNSYNMAGVLTHTKRDDQFLLETSRFNALYDVMSLANAFNMDKVDFMGHQTLVDNFWNFNFERLSELFAEDANFRVFTTDEIELLKTIGAVIVDRNYFMVYDAELESNTLYNEQGMYWNHFLHNWKIYASSPFQNAVALTTSNGEITSIAITPETVTAAKGTSVQFSATVETTGFASKNVVWSLDSDTTASTITAGGLLTIGQDETETTLTVTATAEDGQSASATVTVTD